MQKREQSQNDKKLKSQFEEMTKKMEEQSKENIRLNEELQKTLEQLLEHEKNKERLESEQKDDGKTKPAAEDKIQEGKAPAEAKAVNETKKINIALHPRAEGELGLVSTVLGCRENRDRIEFARISKSSSAGSQPWAITRRQKRQKLASPPITSSSCRNS